MWEIKDRDNAQNFHTLWCQDAMQSGIKQLIKIAKTLAVYRSGLLNYFNHHITSGAVEGLVNKIKTLKRQAYGFRDITDFKNNSGFKAKEYERLEEGEWITRKNIKIR